MNALVGVRNNTLGQLTPSPAVRSQVSAKLSEVSDVYAGKSTRAASSSGTTSSTSETDSSRLSGDTLDKDAFLQLLVLQMKNQDPLEPMDNGEMLAQLAQFSSLEGQNNLNESFQELTSNMDQLNFISASQMLGKVVQGVNIDGEFMTGTVEGVHLDGSLVVLTVDGQFMPMSGIVRVGIEEAFNKG